jgi:hypothetical protein
VSPDPPPDVRWVASPGDGPGHRWARVAVGCSPLARILGQAVWIIIREMKS